MKRATVTTLALVPVAALGFAGVASGGGVHAAKATRTTSADPDGDLSFTKKKLSAPRGRVTLVMKNPRSAGLPHAIAVRGKSGKTVGPGGTSRVTKRFRKAGTYRFWCPVAGHRAAGMTGRITIK